MNRFIVLSFVVMGFGYYELSGGADFVAETRPTAVAEAAAPETAPEAEVDLAGIEVVTRADTSTLDEVPGVDAAVAEAISLEPAVASEAVPEEEFVATSVADALADPTAAIPEATEAASATDLREVTGDLVNMRDGPGTDFGVVDRLGRGSLIEVLETGADGWVRVLVETSGQTGWMSEQFLTAING